MMKLVTLLILASSATVMGQGRGGNTGGRGTNTGGRCVPFHFSPIRTQFATSRSNSGAGAPRLRVPVTHSLPLCARLQTYSGSPDDPSTETRLECHDGVDNDGDGQGDCDDPDCANQPNCQSSGGHGGRGSPQTDDAGTETRRECGDGLDNDGDGQADCDDPDCATHPMCQIGAGCRNMAMAAARVTATCCAGVDCSTGVPTTCTASCAPVFLDFMDDCSSMITAIPGMASQYTALQTSCQDVDQTANSGGTTGLQDCGYNSAIQISMSCSRVRGDFCTSDCYQSLSPFMAQCQDQISPTITMLLSSAITLFKACNPTDVVPGGPTDGASYGAGVECSALVAGDGQATLMATCNPKGAATMPSVCSHECADVFVPLYTSCGAQMQAIMPGIASFAAVCQAAQGH